MQPGFSLLRSSQLACQYCCLIWSWPMQWWDASCSVDLERPCWFSRSRRAPEGRKSRLPGCQLEWAAPEPWNSLSHVSGGRKQGHWGPHFSGHQGELSPGVSGLLQRMHWVVSSCFKRLTRALLTTPCKPRCRVCVWGGPSWGWLCSLDWHTGLRIQHRPPKTALTTWWWVQGISLHFLCCVVFYIFRDSSRGSSFLCSRVLPGAHTHPLMSTDKIPWEGFPWGLGQQWGANTSKDTITPEWVLKPFFVAVCHVVLTSYILFFSFFFLPTIRLTCSYMIIRGNKLYNYWWICSLDSETNRTYVYTQAHTFIFIFLKAFNLSNSRMAQRRFQIIEHRSIFFIPD